MNTVCVPSSQPRTTKSPWTYSPIPPRSSKRRTTQQHQPCLLSIYHIQSPLSLEQPKPTSHHGDVHLHTLPPPVQQTNHNSLSCNITDVCNLHRYRCPSWKRDVSLGSQPPKPPFSLWRPAIRYQRVVWKLRSELLRCLRWELV